MRKRKQQALTPSKSAAGAQTDPQTQLDSFLAKYDPDVAAFARRALSKMRKARTWRQSRWSMTTTTGWSSASARRNDLEAIFSWCCCGEGDAVLSAGRGIARPCEAPQGQRQCSPQRPPLRCGRARRQSTRRSRSPRSYEYSAQPRQSSDAVWSAPQANHPGDFR